MTEDVSRRTVLSLVGTAAATATIATRASAATDEGAEEAPTALSVAFSDTMYGLDPHDYRNDATNSIVENCYDGLLSRGPDGRIVPSLATDFLFRDGTTLRFPVRTGVRFHSGNELTVDDVVYSIRRQATSVGGDQSSAGLFTTVSAVRAVDDRTVEVTLEEPDGAIVSSFANKARILEKAWATARSDGAIEREVNGTGPYRLDSFEDYRAQLRRNDEYWGDLPAVETLDFRSVSSDAARTEIILDGGVDVLADVPLERIDAIRRSTDVEVVQAPGDGVRFFGMRNDEPPFDNEHFRKAMNYAVDLDELVGLFDGTVRRSGQPVPSSFLGYADDVDPYPHDPAKAEELVERSGYAGASITLRASQDSYAHAFEVATKAAERIDALSNVSCEVEAIDFSTLVQQLIDEDFSKTPQFYNLGWYSNLLDAENTFDSLFTLDSQYHIFEDDAVDAAITSLGKQYGSDRVAAMEALNRTLHETAPVVFLFSEDSLAAVRGNLNWTPRSAGTVYGPDFGTVQGSGGASFAVTRLSVPDSVSPDESFQIAMMVENTGSASGRARATVSVDGVSVTDLSVSVEAGSQATMTYTIPSGVVTELGPGTHTLGVTLDGETVEKRFTVVAETTRRTTAADDAGGTSTTGPETGDGADGETASTDAGEATEDDGDVDVSFEDETPGFGALSGLAALLGGLGLRRLREDED